MPSSNRFRSIRAMTASQRAEQLLPLGWTHPLGARGRDVRARSEPAARDGSLPRMEEASTMPDATYAFWHETQPGPEAAADGRWRLASKDIVSVAPERVTHTQGTTPGQVTTPWTEAWRTGLTAWTRDTRELVGAWVRDPNAPKVAPTWQSLRQIDAQRDVDLLVWLPTWSAWRLVPRRAAPAFDTPTIDPAATSPRPASQDTLFLQHGGPCADAPGGLAKAFPRYRSALAGLEVHIVDRGDVRHYLHVWGETEWQGKSNLLPQASVVFVCGGHSKLAEFYAWMRHVALPVYPVLHDAEWARDHDNDEAYDPAACGHPALLATPVEGVAVAIVFDEDLRALRDALTTQLQCPTSTGDAPDWVPALSEPYDHPLALAAAWAVTDPRVGWRAWAARRPYSWSMKLSDLFRNMAWPTTLQARRWGHFETTKSPWLNTDALDFYVRPDARPSYTEGRGVGYQTDNIGRLPIVRDLWQKSPTIYKSYSATYHSSFSVDAVAAYFEDCDVQPETSLHVLSDGHATHMSTRFSDAAAFVTDATRRITNVVTNEAEFLGAGTYRFGWSATVNWRRGLSRFTTLSFPKIRESLTAFVFRFTDDFRWGRQCLFVGDTAVAELHEDGLVTVPGLAPVFLRATSSDWFRGGAPNLPYDDDERYGLSRASRVLTVATIDATSPPSGSAIASLERQIGMLPAAAAHRDILAAILAHAREVMAGTQHDTNSRFLLFSEPNAGEFDWYLYLFDTRDGFAIHVLAWFSYHKEWRKPRNYSIGKGVAPMDYVRGVFKHMLERKITTSPTTPSQD